MTTTNRHDCKCVVVFVLVQTPLRQPPSDTSMPTINFQLKTERKDIGTARINDERDTQLRHRSRPRGMLKSILEAICPTVSEPYSQTEQ